MDLSTQEMAMTVSAASVPRRRVAAGPGRYLPNGQRLAMEVAVGDKIIRLRRT